MKGLIMKGLEGQVKGFKLVSENNVHLLTRRCHAQKSISG